ncbi:MAG: hypothetical protein ACOVOI_16040 [Hyphomicrobiales bacterium]
MSAPTAMITTHVPVDTTVKGRGRVRRCGRSEAFESWAPASTRVVAGRPVALTIAGSSGPTLA